MSHKLFEWEVYTIFKEPDKLFFLFLMELALKKALSSSLKPKPNVTWDKSDRIWKYKRIWDLPEHYKTRFWRNIIADWAPVHFKPPEKRFLPHWVAKRNNDVIETENYPIVPIYPPEADLGLWGGEGVVKGYIVSQPYTRKKVLPRQWVPRFWFPELRYEYVYSEILDLHMRILVTERTMTLIDDAYGFDNYILRTPEYDLHSALGCKLKRLMLVTLAKDQHAPGKDEQTRNSVAARYSHFKIPLDEAEWIGLTLNEACAKLQDMYEMSGPLKYHYERECVTQEIESDETANK